jgi:hypothetical protein
MTRDTSIVDAHAQGDLSHEQAMTALREKRIVAVLDILDWIERGGSRPSPTLIRRAKEYVRRLGGAK